MTKIKVRRKKIKLRKKLSIIKSIRIQLWKYLHRLCLHHPKRKKDCCIYTLFTKFLSIEVSQLSWITSRELWTTIRYGRKLFSKQILISSILWLKFKHPSIYGSDVQIQGYQQTRFVGLRLEKYLFIEM